MERSIPARVLCTPCCSRYPGRDWMRSGLDDCDIPAEIADDDVENICA
jgi:hypothetical protein